MQAEHAQPNLLLTNAAHTMPRAKRICPLLCMADIRHAIQRAMHPPQVHLWLTQARVECEHPNASLYTFTGNLLLAPPTTAAEATCPLSQVSVLLRGCTLRNTGSVLGIAIFTGHETKVCPIAACSHLQSPLLVETIRFRLRPDISPMASHPWHFTHGNIHCWTV